MDDGTGTGDSDFDGCECIWTHELATRRIISMIRQTQDYCTENECLTDGQGGNGTSSASDMSMFFIGLWFLLAIMLFFMRPNRTTSVTKGTSNNYDDSNYGPPAPMAS